MTPMNNSSGVTGYNMNTTARKRTALWISISVSSVAKEWSFRFSASSRVITLPRNSHQYWLWVIRTPTWSAEKRDRTGMPAGLWWRSLHIHIWLKPGQKMRGIWAGYRYYSHSQYAETIPEIQTIVKERTPAISSTPHCACAPVRSR